MLLREEIVEKGMSLAVEKEKVGLKSISKVLKENHYTWIHQALTTHSTHGTMQDNFWHLLENPTNMKLLAITLLLAVFLLNGHADYQSIEMGLIP